MNVSRQIGWSNESNLLYQILKQLNRLSSIMFGLKPKYKVYTALLTQTGVTAPVATVLENTIGVISFTYQGVGDYTIDSSGLFTNSKTFFLLTNPNVGNGVVSTATYNDIDSIGLVFYDNASPYLSLDNVLQNTPIEIRVYN